MTDDIVTDRQEPDAVPMAGMLSQPGKAPVNVDDLREYWPGDTSGSVVAALREEFPGYRISRELVVGQVRYVACRLHPDTHPHTVMSADPDRLRAALNAGRS
jgi:hypothetical protein